MSIGYNSADPVAGVVNELFGSDVLKRGITNKDKYESKILSMLGDKPNIKDLRELLSTIKNDTTVTPNEKRHLARYIRNLIPSDSTSKLQNNDLLDNVPKEYRHTVTPVGKTPKTGANVFIHDDTKNENGGKWTDYLCGHVFRTTSEAMGTKNLKHSGFIHMGEKPKKEQYLEVLGTGIKGFADKLKDKKNITIMVTGFTQFQTIKDNPTSKFLFGDGKSTEPSSFGFKKPTVDIDNMMKETFGEFKEPPKPFYVKKDGKQVEAGRTYTFTDPVTKEAKVINLATVRLPVDTDFNNKGNTDNNLEGDGTGNILKSSISTANPDAIISFGAGTPGNDNYYIETNSYGAKGLTLETDDNGLTGHAEYKNNENYSKNNSLGEIYTNQLKK